MDAPHEGGRTAARVSRQEDPHRPDTAAPAETELHDASRFARLSLLGLVALLAGAVPFLALLALMELRWEPLHQLDLAIADGLNALVAAQPLLVRVLEIITEVGGGATAGLVITAAAAWLAIRRHRRLAVYVLVSAIGLAVLVPVTKVLIGRARPDVAIAVVDLPTNASFPSGHAMTAMVVWGTLGVVALSVLRPSRRKPLVAVTVTFILLVGFTRLALGVHFLTDVLAGYALGAAWVAIATAAFRRWLRHRHEPADLDHVDWEDDAGMSLAPVAEPALPAGGRSAAKLAGAALLIGALITGLGLLITGPWGTVLGRWESAVVEQAVALRSPELTAVFDRVSVLAGLWGVVWVAVATIIVANAYRGSWRPALFMILAMVGEVALYGASSQIVGRARPDVRDLTAGLPAAASYPSGHVAAATVLYGAVCILVFRYAQAWWRWLLLVVTVLIVVATMVSRVYLAAHYPTDTLAGLILGLLWLAVLTPLVLGPRTTRSAQPWYLALDRRAAR